MSEIIPLELYTVRDFGGQAAAVAASATYIGANAVMTLTNNGSKVGIIPANSIVISTDQVYEAVAYDIWSGAERALGQEVAVRYQYGDANISSVLQHRMIVLKPGERFRVRIFNRAPAAAANISASMSFYEIETRVYDQMISRAREKVEAGVQ